MMIAPIQTWYKDYHMRSRLEARWAVFFDALGLAWRYEVEGFDLGAAGYYLPDFWLPELRLWCEVKGAKPPAGDLRKLQALAEGQGSNVLLLVGDPGAPEAIGDHNQHNWSYNGRLFIGDFLAVEPMTEHHYLGRYRLESLATFLQEKVEEGLITGPAPAFDGSQASLQILLDLDRQYHRAKYGREHPSWEYGYNLDELRWCERQPGQWSLSGADGTAFAEHTTPALQAAYQAARSARFEHGEQPITSAATPLPAPAPAGRRTPATHTIAQLMRGILLDQVVGVIEGKLGNILVLPAEQQGTRLRGTITDATATARLQVPDAIYAATAPLWVSGERVLITGRVVPHNGDFAGIVCWADGTIWRKDAILEVQTVQELPA